LKTSHPNPEIEARKQGATAATLIDEIQKRESLAPLLMQAFDSGRLCERVVHNDPKVNNILFDVHSHQGIGMIDLDTVKPGLIQFDYGDCLRTAANPAGEETQNLQEVEFDLSVFERITKGYLEEAKDILTEADTAYLVDSIKLMTFEMVIRFFADYLRGDVYFRKISYPTQNLNRAHVQLVLLKDIEQKESQIRRMLERLMRET
jgi:Ser/Thr protein kinase RdoA (MazF antagonist)